MSDQALMTYQVASSSDVPASQRYEHWLIPLLSDFEAAPPDAHQRQDFKGRATSLMSGSLQLHEMHSDDFQGTRSRKHIRAHQDDKLALIYVMQGHVVSEYENDIDTVTQEGQFFLFDGARPNRMRFHRPRFIQINLSRPRMEAILPGRMIPSQVHKALSCSNLSALLAYQVTQFSELGSTLSTHERYSFLEATEALASSVMESAVLDHHPRDTGRYLGLYTAAQRYIRLHLASANLNSHAIASALGCSRATLYRAFSEYGVSVADQVRELRLQKLARLLQNPMNTVPIAQLAQSCGLHDAPNLSRVFRQRFGISPQEFRVSALL